MVEIAKALSLNARIIIMDEPTSNLTLTKTDCLLGLIAGLRSEGVSKVLGIPMPFVILTIIGTALLKVLQNLVNR